MDSGTQTPKFPGTAQNLLNHLSTYLTCAVVLSLVLQPPNGHFYFTKFYRHYRKLAKLRVHNCRFYGNEVKLSKVKVPIRWLWYKIEYEVGTQVV